MFDIDFSPVNPELLASIREQMKALKLVVGEMEEYVQIFWVSWEEFYLYDCITERFEEAQTLLSIFNNTDETTCPSKDEMKHRIYKFTTLTRSLNRCLNVLGSDAISWKEYTEDYLKFLKVFSKFTELTAKLQDDMGSFC